MSFVFVLDTTHRPLIPVHPGKARRLLKERRAAVWRRFPFTIIRTTAGRQMGINARYCQPLHLNDGYRYTVRAGRGAQQPAPEATMAPVGAQAFVGAPDSSPA